MFNQVLKTALCYILAIFFLAAAIAHFIYDDSFASIVPPALPFPYVIVWLTGIIEAVLAVMLVIPRWRAWAGLIFAPYLLAVLPANIYMAVAGIGFNNHLIPPAILWIRVALQFPFIMIIV